MHANITRRMLHAVLLEALGEKGTPETRHALRVGRGGGKRADSHGKSAHGTHGDFWTNAAQLVASRAQDDKRSDARGDAHGNARRDAGETARSLCDSLQGKRVWPGSIEEASGFLNFRFDDDFLKEQIARAQAEGARFGAGDTLSGKRVLVEFVSADPTGPLPFGFGRIAAAGDGLCRILAFAGADVTREFYLNDVETSSKMRLLGESVAALYARHFGHDATPPEGALSDRFVQRVASEIAERDGNTFLLALDSERTATFAHHARDAAVASQKATLGAFGVRFDVWTSEAALRAEGRVESTLSKLEERGFSYLKDGATWLRTTNFGDRADRVLVRQNGERTYLASDIAYHVFKFERGFDLVCNIWTSEHHEYIDRTRAALQAAGCDAAKLEVIVCESARWLSGDKIVARGKDGGTFALDDALREVSTDALHFLFARAAWDAPLTLDAEAARRDDESNPAYAALLLPARLTTMIGEAEAHGSKESGAWSDEERELARLVALWPDTAETAATERVPHLVAGHISEMAAATRALLKASRAGAAPDANLLRAAKIVASCALGLLGITARDRF